MSKTHHEATDSGNLPTPIFASANDIAIAERLRRELELRYLGSSDAQTTPELVADVH